MTKTLAGLLVAIFVALGMLHVYWAFGGAAGSAAAVPSFAGKPLFRPLFAATLLVASALFAAALTICAAVGWLGTIVPARVARAFTFVIAVVFLLRAIGNFQHVGFFKRVSETPFAHWDTWLYSPLCVFIAVSAFVVARRQPE